MFKHISVGLSLLAVAITAHADNKFISGQYEFIKIAVTPDKRIEGFYFEEMGEGVVRRCSFLFEGKLSDNINEKTPIKTYSSEIIDGMLDHSKDSMLLELASEHPGCGSASASEAVYGLDVALLEPKNWIGIGVAKDEKVYLKSSLLDEKEGKVYIVNKDRFGIIEVNDDYSHIEYINPNTNKSYKGWIKNSSYMSVKEAMGQ